MIGCESSSRPDREVVRVIKTKSETLVVKADCRWLGPRKVYGHYRRHARKQDKKEISRRW
jgi:hypothetical protein